MATVHDVAAYILSQGRPITTMKLQKLLFYGQAWSLAWDGEPLFSAPINAWKFGPVVREVFSNYQGRKVVHAAMQGDASALTVAQRATVDAVLGFYGAFDGDLLSELTHKERPWRDAWNERRGGTEITHGALRAHYRADIAPPKGFPPAFRRGIEMLMEISKDEAAVLSTSEESGVHVDDEVAFLEGRGPDPWRR